MKLRNEKARRSQEETDATCDHLKEERDTFCMEMNKLSDMYEEQKQKHKTKVEELEKEMLHFLQGAEAEKHQLQNRIAHLENEYRSLHKTSAAARQEFEQAKQRGQYYFDEWQNDKKRLEEQLVVTGNLSDELSIVTHQKSQAETNKAKLQQEIQRLEEAHRNDVKFYL